MNKYSYFSERAALEHALSANITQRSEKIINIYLKSGFEAVAEHLDLYFQWQREFVFDVLVFDYQLLHLLINSNQSFFLGMIAEGNGKMIRQILGITKAKYNGLWISLIKELNKFFMQKLLDEKMFNSACFSFFDVLKLKTSKDKE